MKNPFERFGGDKTPKPKQDKPLEGDVLGPNERPENHMFDNEAEGEPFDSAAILSKEGEVVGAIRKELFDSGLNRHDVQFDWENLMSASITLLNVLDKYKEAKDADTRTNAQQEAKKILAKMSGVLSENVRDAIREKAASRPDASATLKQIPKQEEH